ncbi:MAG: type II toxin-antitoxin system PrlF family antitoxin [Candidatus Blackburnbacteria bacterium]|nr:type II toxin-antitoxin system PrlF family antitoxin [Candidatus Blackburnbacteria bacterium]
MQIPATTITQKGQVTLPVQVRRLLKLKTGDKVKFVVTPQKEVKVKLAKRVSIMHLYGSIKPQVETPKFKSIQELVEWESQAWPEAATERDRRTLEGNSSKSK